MDSSTTVGKKIEMGDISAIGEIEKNSESNTRNDEDTSDENSAEKNIHSDSGPISGMKKDTNLFIGCCFHVINRFDRQ